MNTSPDTIKLISEAGCAVSQIVVFNRVCFISLVAG